MADGPGRVVVIPTYNRPEVLVRCLEAAVPQADMVFVIDNSEDPARYWVRDQDTWPKVYLARVPMRPPNLSRLWNLGIGAAERWARSQGYERWDVAVLNDDAIIPPDWFNAVSAAMRDLNCAAASTGLPGSPGQVLIHRTPGTTALYQRMQGHAFMLRGEANLRADKRLSWWCGDNDLDMQARERSGTVILAGWPVEHLHPDQSTTGELAAQTAVDMQTFVDKWGWRPW